MKLYKLTDENDQTRGGCQWGENVEVITSGDGELCGPGFTHWYTHPLLAVLLNPIHGDYYLTTAHLWVGEGDVVKTDHGLKVGCTKAKTIKQIKIPEITLTQKIAFGILGAMKVCKNKDFQAWARNWLDGTDRTKESAESAARAARVAWAGESAYRAAASAESEASAERAAWAAEGAEWAAARGVGKPLDLIALAKQAMRIK